MNKTAERNNRKQMERYNGGVRFVLDIKDGSSNNLLKVRKILEDVEAKTALIKDALVHFINSEDFDIEQYEGPGHRRRMSD